MHDTGGYGILYQLHPLLVLGQCTPRDFLHLSTLHALPHTPAYDTLSLLWSLDAAPHTVLR
jgi:hypothetical protein